MARYLIHCFVTAALTAAVLTGLSVYCQPLDGDLTSIGAWAERDFGWNAPRTRLAPTREEASHAAPGVLVLGDSFSFSRPWQSVLAAEAGMNVLSFSYRSAGCIENWVRWATESTADAVIIEVVERNFIRTFSGPPGCAPHVPEASEVKPAGPLTRSTALRWPPGLDAYYLVRTAINTLTMNAGGQRPVRGNLVVNVAIRHGCGAFSHRREDRMLYYAEDEGKNSWKEADVQATIANVLRLQQEVLSAGKRFVFVVVPDKLTIYEHCIAQERDRRTPNAPNITSRLIAAGAHAPDMVTVFRALSASAIDLYDPNNTHLGPNGYFAMGRTVEQALNLR
ncbi:MAG: hypothetical protein JWO70_4518 [Betaproteobacteria bacterium]|nr:hypothetical protein [Betaproteobacteria bacterium]